MLKTRYIPSGFKPFMGGDSDVAVVYWDGNTAKPSAIAYAGKRTKHEWYTRFYDYEHFNTKAHSLFENLLIWEKQKAERKEARKAPHSLKVGDILYSSWGYDQTNINFYQVIRVISNRTVEIREVHSKITGSSIPSNYVVAVKDSFMEPRGEYDKRGLPMVKRVSAKNTIKISSYEFAWLWDGKEKSETMAGYGH